MNIVSVQFQSRPPHPPSEFSGREYSYYSKVELEVGDVIEAPTKNGSSTVRVSRVNVPDTEINDHVRPFMRTIEKKIVPESVTKTQANNGVSMGCSEEIPPQTL